MALLQFTTPRLERHPESTIDAGSQEQVGRSLPLLSTLFLWLAERIAYVYFDASGLIRSPISLARVNRESRISFTAEQDPRSHIFPFLHLPSFEIVTS